MYYYDLKRTFSFMGLTKKKKTDIDYQPNLDFAIVSSFVGALGNICPSDRPTDQRPADEDQTEHFWYEFISEHKVQTNTRSSLSESLPFFFR